MTAVVRLARRKRITKRPVAWPGALARQARSSPWSDDRWDGIHHLLQQQRVMDVGCRQVHGQRYCRWRRPAGGTWPGLGALDRVCAG